MLTLLTLAALVCLNTAIVFDGPCHVVPEPINNTQRNNTVEIPATCKTGTIAWDYPMAVLRIHLAQPEKSFILCLVDSSLTSLGGVHDITGGTYTELPVPTKGNPTCTVSDNREATFLVDSAKPQMYMTYIDYSVDFITFG